MSELMECPTCGRRAELESAKVERDWWCSEIRCVGVLDGSCGTSMMCGAKTKSDSVRLVERAWNTRQSKD